MTIKAIETRYAGCRFRSRLEARWAVFFDHLGIRWEYEPQGFELPSGPYLPDFLLRDLTGDARNGKTWFEVKNEEAKEDPRWRELTAMTKIPTVVAFGMPDPRDDMVLHPIRLDGWMEVYTWDGLHYFPGYNGDGVGWDCHRAFNVCLWHSQIGIMFEGDIERICSMPADAERRCFGSLESIGVAYKVARSARFEHGERG